MVQGCVMHSERKAEPQRTHWFLAAYVWVCCNLPHGVCAFVIVVVVVVVVDPFPSTTSKQS